MKKILLIITVMMGSLAYSGEAKSQISIHVNIGSQPVWGPVGYDYAEYYYLPDIESYYYVPRHQFVYLSNGRWIFSSSLPPRYRNYDLYSGYKVVMNEPSPYLHFNEHRSRYSNYRGNRSQVIIRNSNEPKYYIVKGHPHYNDRGRGNGNGNGNNGRGNGNGNENGNNGRGNGNGNGNNGRGNGNGNGNNGHGNGHDNGKHNGKGH
jgi:hypothetical protein